MQKPLFTEYEAEELVAAKKYAIAHPLRNTLFRSDQKSNLREMVVSLRRKDMQFSDLVLVFGASVRTVSISGVKSGLRPSALLQWHGKRIRAIEYNIVHDVIENRVPTGKQIKGWHEHFWTDSDEDARIREPEPPIRNSDIFSILRWCSDRWNIEGLPSNEELF
jgi:hypothetical protein